MATLPFDTDALVKQSQQMLAQTSAEGTKQFAGSSFDTITPQQLQPQTPITPVVAPTTPIPDTTSLQSQIDVINKQYATPLPGAEAISTERQRVSELIGQLYGGEGEQATRARLEADPLLQQKRQQVLDLSSRYEALAAEAKAIPLQIQQQATGQGVTAGGVAPLQTAALRNNAIQALSVGSLLSAAQGNLSLALDQVDRAVKAQFEPLKGQLEARRANLELLLSDPNITREENRRAEIAKATLNWQQAQNDKAENDRRSVLELAAKLGGFGVDNAILTRIQGAKSFDEAMKIAAPYMQSPESKLALENARLDNTLRVAQIKREQYELALLQKYDGLSPTQYAQTLAAEQKAIDEAKTEQEKNERIAETIGGKIILLDSVLENKAIDSVVGPTAFARTTSGLGAVGRLLTTGLLGRGFSAVSDVFSGDSDRLIGQTEQFISKEFLQNLIDVKAQGATFGALQKAEQDALTAAATYIGNRRIYAGSGDDKRVIGYDMSEADFKREIKMIQDMARLAHQRAIGKSFSSDEMSILDSIFQQTNDPTSADFDPANYF